MANLVNYMREARQELSKVTWPTREETVRNTMAVIAVALVVAIFLGSVDILLGFILNRFIL
jgi:preprotein translocase subunit SecE